MNMPWLNQVNKKENKNIKNLIVYRSLFLNIIFKTVSTLDISCCPDSGVCLTHVLLLMTLKIKQLLYHEKFCQEIEHTCIEIFEEYHV
jgi:hypothetical protein